MGPFDLVIRLWVEQGVLRAMLAMETDPPATWQVVYLEDTAVGRGLADARVCGPATSCAIRRCDGV